MRKRRWPAILTLVNLWKSAGFWSIVYLAGIISINPEYYEAARVDGAGKWQQIGWSFAVVAVDLWFHTIESLSTLFYSLIVVEGARLLWLHVAAFRKQG